MAVFWKALLAPVLFLVVFNPYTIYGKPGVLMGVLFLLVSFVVGTYKVVLNNYLIPVFLVLLISLWGVLVSHLNDIGQFDFLYSALSFVFFVFTACGIVGFLIRKKISFDDFAELLLYVILFNSIFILLEVSIPAVRDATESFLAPAGNIDWTQGIRYRGLAASGGSGLSVCCTLGFIIALDLYRNKQIGLLFFYIFVIRFFNKRFVYRENGSRIFPCGYKFLFWLSHPGGAGKSFGGAAKRFGVVCHCYDFCFILRDVLRLRLF